MQALEEAGRVNLHLERARAARQHERPRGGHPRLRRLQPQLVLQGQPLRPRVGVLTKAVKLEPEPKVVSPLGSQSTLRRGVRAAFLGIGFRPILRWQQVHPDPNIASRQEVMTACVGL